MNRKLFAVATGILMCCQAALADETLPLPVKTVDITPPKITHKPIKDTVEAGKPAIVSAGVTDADSGVKDVSLFFRTKGTTQYNRVKMESKDGSEFYIAEIPERYVSGPGVEYYIEASDAAGNKILRGVNFSPMVIAVTGAASGPVSDSGNDIPRLGSQAAGEDTASAEMDSGKSQEKDRNWLYWAAGGLGASVLYCYSSCSCAKKCDGPEGNNTGSVTVRAPAP